MIFPRLGWLSLLVIAHAQEITYPLGHLKKLRLFRRWCMNTRLLDHFQASLQPAFRLGKLPCPHASPASQPVPARSVVRSKAIWWLANSHMQRFKCLFCLILSKECLGLFQHLSGLRFMLLAFLFRYARRGSALAHQRCQAHFAFAQKEGDRAAQTLCQSMQRLKRRRHLAALHCRDVAFGIRRACKLLLGHIGGNAGLAHALANDGAADRLFRTFASAAGYLWHHI